MLITLRCTLHRCSSRDIHPWKLCCSYNWKPSTKMENIEMVKIIVKKVASELAHRNQKIRLPPLAMHVDVWTWCTWPQRYVHKHDIGMCARSFRRFTYGNLVTTSPSSKWWGSLHFERHVLQSWTNQSPNYSPKHSIGASGGRCVHTAGTQSARADDFRLIGISSLKINNCNNLSPSRCHCRLPNLFRQGYKLAECISVARVQPRTPKGITDLLLPQTSLR